MPHIESLLAARLFLAPQLVEQRLFFVSNLSGRLSLYAMDLGGSVPEPLLPPQIALQNPDLIGGYTYYVFPRLGTILVMIDHDGDENYQPMLIPIDGGIPEPAFGQHFAHFRVHCVQCDPETQRVYLNAESRREGSTEAYAAELASGNLTKLGASAWGHWVAGFDAEHRRVALVDGYTVGDSVLYLWMAGSDRPRLLFGTPLEDRAEGQQVPLNSISSCFFTPEDCGMLCTTSLFSDTYGLGYLPLATPADLPLATPADLQPVEVAGTIHTGMGELTALDHLHDNRYLLGYNIDGCSWYYTGVFDEAGLTMRLDTILCGTGELRDGVAETVHYDKAGDRFAISFATAISPTQIYTMNGDGTQVERRTRERLLGLSSDLLSPGEDASFISWDGLRVSARLYLPAPTLGFGSPRPLVYYVHGGPQGQERPDFSWFSMPLIQFLTLNGFAVFVPNARGSTGYGLAYTKQVDRDWGGKDRLDHVHAMSLLANDPRLDVGRAAVVGRSYGGYMTLTLASRYPGLWSAAVDMFGPYDLIKFMDALPETWKPYFAIAVGDQTRDREFLVERSPATYIHHIQCPMLVIQGKNDPRVVEPESRQVVEGLRELGKEVEYLVFENEGHDVLKFENRVTCYNAITAFFRTHLEP